MSFFCLSLHRFLRTRNRYTYFDCEHYIEKKVTKEFSVMMRTWQEQGQVLKIEYGHYRKAC